MANQIQMLMYEGYLAGDPEMRYTPSGKPVTNFRMGSNRKYNTADGREVKETTWLKVAAWGKLAEIVNQYCGKGSHVIVTGLLRPGENGSPTVFPTRDGGHSASFEVTANSIRILKGKDGATESVAETPEDSNPMGMDDEEIPF